MKKIYRELYNIDSRPVLSQSLGTSQYTVRFGDCPICKEPKALMVTIREPREWAYCCNCKESRSLHWLHTRSRHQADKTMLLWQYYQYCLKDFNSYVMDTDLRKRLGIPRGEEEPLNKFFFSNFVGSCNIATMRHVFKMEDMRFTGLHELPDGGEGLCIPIQSSPGFIVGFFMITEEGDRTIIRKRYEEEARYLYPHLNTAHVCRVYEDLSTFKDKAAMPICMGGLFNAIVQVTDS